MSLRDQLNDAGITLRSYADGNHKTLCPRCSHTRRKKKDPCLSVTIDHDSVVWKCHNCEWADGFKERLDDGYEPRKRKPKPKKPQHQHNAPPDQMYQWFQKRGISRKTVERAKITYGKIWMPQLDKEVNTIQFPYFRAGEVINVKYRDAKKNFRQVKGAEKIFYGLDDLDGQDWCVIVEGELDKLALAEAGIQNVLSVPDGAPKQVSDDDIDPENDAKYEYIWNCKAYLDQLDKIVLAVDADSAGKALEEELARRIGKDKCWRVTWPSLNDAQMKDANEVLLDSGPEVLAECIDTAEPFPIADLHDVDSFREDVVMLYREGQKATFTTGWYMMDEYYKVRPGELAIITGLPGSGKSEWLDALLVNLAEKHGWVHALCSFENPPNEHIAKLAEKRISAPFGEGPSMRMSESELNTALDWLQQHFHFIRAEDEPPTIDWILEKAKAAVMRYGIKGLVIDPYNEIEHQREKGQSETEYVSQVLSKVKRFLQIHDVAGFFVAHPAKLPRDKGGKLPTPTLYDISGSAHWVNKADNGIVIDRCYDVGMEKEVTAYLTKIRFKAVGKVGSVIFEYDPRTGRYDTSTKNYRD